MGMASSTSRTGRPPKIDADGVATRGRLLAAAVASCVSLGFEGATVADIAERAGVSGPAIYRHFGDKAELMVAAGRGALDSLTNRAGGRLDPAATARLYLSPEFADTRRLLSELHLAGLRHPEVAKLLADWHRTHAEEWDRRFGGPHPSATTKTFFALLLGLCQIDALSALASSPDDVAECMDDVMRSLFPEEDHR